jgi:hypothetical protein
MSGLDWTLSIHDNISKPAKAAAGALRASEDALLGNDEAAKKAQTSTDRLAESKAKLAAASRAMAAAAKAESDAISKAQATALAAANKNAAKVQSDKDRADKVAFKLKSDDKMARLDAFLEAKNQGKGRFADGRSLETSGRAPGAAAQGLQALTKAFGPGPLQAISAFAEGYDKVGAALSKVAGPALAAASALLALGAAGVGLAAAAGKLLYDAAAFKQSTMFAFEKLTGTKQAAGEAYAMATKTAVMVGAPLEEAMGSIQKLMARGFDARFADEMTRAMYDLKKVNPSANIDAITTAIAQVQSKGSLRREELFGQLGESMNVGNVEDILAKKLGLGTRAAVEAAMAAGKVSAAQGIDAIMEEIRRSKGGGAFGSTAQEATDQSLPGQIARAETLKDVLLAGARVDWSPLTRGMQRLNAALDSKAAKGFVDAVGAQLSRVFAAVDKISQADMESVFTAGAKAVTMLGDGLAFAWKWGAALLKSTEGIAPTFTLAYYAGATLIDPVMRTADAVRSIISAIAGAISKVYELAGGFDRAAAAAGAVAAASAGIEAAAGGGKLGKGVAGGTFGLAGAPGLLANGYMAAHDFLGRASGGPVTGGTPYMVGEEGPELFMPRQSGQIVPNDMMARVGRAGERMGQSISNVNNSRSIGNVTVHVNGDGGGALASSFEDALRSVVQSWA